MTSSMHAAIFVGKDYSENPALRQKYSREANCTEIVRRDSKIDSRKRIGDLGSVRIELGKFYTGEAGPGGRRRGDQIHEGKSLCFLRLCIVRWKDARIHQNPLQNGNVEFRGFRTQISTENWMAGHMTLQVLHEIQKLMATLICNEKEFQRRIIFMSMVNDIEWRNKVRQQSMFGKFTNGEYVRQKVRHRSFVIPRALFRRKWYNTLKVKPPGQWDEVAELMLLNFQESHHPIFRATSPLERGQLKTKGGGQFSIHFCAEKSTIAFLFRTFVSANQLSNYGAVADLCEEHCESLFCSDKDYEITKQIDSLKSADLLNVQMLLDQWESTGRPVVHPQKRSAESFERRAIDKIVYRCRICQSSWPLDNPSWRRILMNS